MRDELKTNKRLSDELVQMRHRIIELEALEAERKQAEEALRSSEEQYRRLVELSPGAIIIHTEGKIAFANPSAAKLLAAASPEELLARPLLDFVHPDDQEAVRERLEHAKAEETLNPPGERRLVRFDGTEVEVEITGVPFIYQSKPARQVIIRDLTERKRAEHEAAAAKILREADHLKTELLANVSHELRAPLALIKGYTTALLRYHKKLSDEEKQDFLEEIDQASDRLTELVENVLQFSRLDAGGLSMAKEQISLRPLIAGAIKDIRWKAKGHRFAYWLARSLPAVEADPRRIRQVLDNLLDNAVKYSREGTRIAVRGEPREQEIAISVQDQGIGINPQELTRIFKPFYQLDSGLSRKTGGAGLGLAICKRIVESHGGRIWAESTPGKGSTFTFTLPVPPEARAEGNIRGCAAEPKPLPIVSGRSHTPRPASGQAKSA